MGLDLDHDEVVDVEELAQPLRMGDGHSMATARSQHGPFTNLTAQSHHSKHSYEITAIQTQPLARPQRTCIGRSLWCRTGFCAPAVYLRPRQG